MNMSKKGVRSSGPYAWFLCLLLQRCTALPLMLVVTGPYSTSAAYLEAAAIWIRLSQVTLALY